MGFMPNDCAQSCSLNENTERTPFPKILAPVTIRTCKLTETVQAMDMSRYVSYSGSGVLNFDESVGFFGIFMEV